MITETQVQDQAPADRLAEHHRAMRARFWLEVSVLAAVACLIPFVAAVLP